MTISHPIPVGEVIRIPAPKGDLVDFDPEESNRPAVILRHLPTGGPTTHYHVSPGMTGRDATPPRVAHVAPDAAGRGGLKSIGVRSPIYFCREHIRPVSFAEVVKHAGPCPEGLLRQLWAQAGVRPVLRHEASAPAFPGPPNRAHSLANLPSFLRRHRRARHVTRHPVARQLHGLERENASLSRLLQKREKDDPPRFRSDPDDEIPF